MKLTTILLAIPLALTLDTQAGLILAEDGQAKCVIVRQPGATAPELHALKELAGTLQQITGAEFTIQEADTNLPERAIIVGQGPAARALFPEIDFGKLGAEEIVIKTKGQHLLIAGGRPRGTLYAVSRFLQDQCGVRWWTPWASRIPEQSTLRVGELNIRAQPAFEARDPFWFTAFDAPWAVRNFSNSQSARIPPELGGSIRYKGFVHTFYPLVPPEKHFAEHPEWFSLIKGQRTTQHAQLCLTNPKLRDFTVERVRQWLRESPDASILSVSQNDWYGACECADCKALDEAEGSQAGTMLAFVNYIAEKIEPDFPHVAIDTLAYQYTRKPPKTLKPRTNVIVRLCSIECNFREPLEHPSNASFADDIKGWSKISERLYIWDYTTDFSHYVQPHPNWFVLGQNLRFFQRHNVRGVFEQGAYQSHGSEMAELRAWVLAQLLWNPQQDDRALIDEFLEGYYGPAAPHIRRYLERMHEASRGYNLTCFSPTDTPFLKFQPLSEAEQIWRDAERAVDSHPELLPRVRLGRVPLGYVWLSRWEQLRKECRESGGTWPLPHSRKQFADEWFAIARGVPESPWTRVALLNEPGLTLENFVARFANDPAEPSP
jgi:hypothetical protein